MLPFTRAPFWVPIFDQPFFASTFHGRHSLSIPRLVEVALQVPASDGDFPHLQRADLVLGSDSASQRRPKCCPASTGRVGFLSSTTFVPHQKGNQQRLPCCREMICEAPGHGARRRFVPIAQCHHRHGQKTKTNMEHRNSTGAAFNTRRKMISDPKTHMSSADDSSTVGLFY